MRAAALAALALTVIVLDHVTKTWIAAHFLPGESRIVIPHLLYLTYVQNYHGAFGLFGTHPLLLTAAASAVLIGFYLWYRKEGAATVVHLAFALIFGGAVGNIVDRLRFGYVHDFVDLRFWPVFNVADSAITIGVVMLLGQMLVRERHHATTVAAQGPATDGQSAGVETRDQNAPPLDTWGTPAQPQASPSVLPSDE